MQRIATLAAVAAGLALAAPAAAQDYPKTHLKVVGSISVLPPYKDYELPFWTKHLAAKSNGAEPTGLVNSSGNSAAERR